jgi:cyanophycin synthetase
MIGPQTSRAGLDVTGIDFQTPDLSRSWRDVRCAVLEVNSTPGLRPHMASNPARDVCGPIIEHLFPGGADGRIPTAGITGSLGKTTTCRIVAAMLAAAGHRVALTTTQGAWLGDQLVSRGDAAGGRVAARLLLDPGVDAGVFEIARGGLAKHGMVLDGVDVAAALNVLDNHVGMGGIETRDHLARVKRIVVERARKLAVLNADDPLCLAMREHARAPVALVSMAGCEAAMEHRRAGGLVSHLDEGQRLTLRQGDAVIGTLPVSELPSAWDGRYEPALWHALFAMAIGHGLGIGFDTIAGVLRAFRSSRETNPGRLNVVEGLPFKLVVDHADGGAALAALARFAQGFETRGRRILLLCSATGPTRSSPAWPVQWPVHSTDTSAATGMPCEAGHPARWPRCWPRSSSARACHPSGSTSPATSCTRTA